MSSIPQESSRLLVNNPQKAVRDARFNLQTLRLLAAYWSDYPETIRLGILDMFSHHLNSVNPPRNASQQTRTCEGAYLSITGLCNISKFLEPNFHPDMNETRLAALIPGLLRWSAYFYTAEAERTIIPGQSTRENVKHTIVKAWYELSHSLVVAEAMATTDGVVELAAKFWRLEQVLPEPTYPFPWATSLFTTFLRHKNADTVLRLVNSIGYDTSQTGASVVAELTMSRLKTCTRSLGDSDLNMSRLTAALYMDMLQLLSENKGNPTRNHFLNKHKVIPFCTNMVLMVAQLLDNKSCSASEEEDLLAILSPSIVCLANYLESTDGFTWVLQAIHADILKAFVLSSQHFHLLNDDEIKNFIRPVLNVIPLYTSYRTVTSALDTALRELDKPHYRRLVENSGFKNEWASFRSLVARRMDVVRKAKEIKSRFAMCQNTNCRKLDSRSTFQKCSGCDTTLFCSKECQRAAWKQNHRAICKIKQEEYLQGGKREFNKDDEHFIQFLPVYDVNSNKDKLREQASNPAFKAAKDGGFVVHIDYTKCPEVYTVKPLLWHDWRSETHDIEHKSQGHQDRNDQIVEEVRKNPDSLTMIQSTVKNGEHNQTFVIVMPESVFQDLEGDRIEMLDVD